MSSESVFLLKKNQSDKQLPSFCEGDQIISFWNGYGDFNFWFFSNLGYLLLRDIKILKTDYLLFRILGGSENWLSLSSDLFNIKHIEQSSEVRKEFVKIIIRKIILNNIRTKRVNNILDITDLPAGIEDVLDFYYSQYINQNSYIIYKNESRITYEEACESSKDHDGLYTGFQAIELYQNHSPGDNIKLNTDNFDNISNLSLAYLFAKFSVEEKIIKKIKDFYDNKIIPFSELSGLESFIKPKIY